MIQEKVCEKVALLGVVEEHIQCSASSEVCFGFFFLQGFLAFSAYVHSFLVSQVLSTISMAFSHTQTDL